MWWWAGCSAGDFDVELVESELAPAALRARWEGPAGRASLWFDDGALDEWEEVRGDAVAEGETTWPLGLLPAGTSRRARVEVEVDGEVRRSAPFTVRVPAAPRTLGRPHLARERDGSEAATGFVVTHRYSQADDAAAVILDGQGQVVWWTTSRGDGRRVIRARPSADGRSVLVLWDHASPEERRIERIPLDGSEGVETIAPDATHDFWEDGDGTFTYLAYDLRDDVHIVGDLPAVANRLRTVPEGATDPAEVVDGFAFFDDYPAAPWFTCSHAAFGAFVDGANEWTHVSSLVRAPDDDGWWLMVRHFDAIVAVGDDGAFRWQAGGRDGTLTALDGAQFEHAHASHAWGDRILVFDNGDHSPRPIVSRVVELRIDPDAGAWEEVWSLPAPSGTFESFLGDARRLPGGHTLVAWTDIGEIAEYTPEGEEVWRVDTTEHYGRATWVPELTP